MTRHESYLDTPQIVHVGENGRVGLRGVTERRTSARKVVDKIETADCIVCGHAPPEYDALAVLKAVRERDTSLPFFIITDDEQTIARALSAGVTDCVGPDRHEILAHKIDHAIDAYRTEQTLDQTKAILSGLADAVVTVDERGAIRYANDGVERVLGYDPGEMVGRQLTAVIPAVFQSVHETSFERYIGTGERRLDWEHIETIARHRDGAEVPVLLSLHNGESGGDELITGIIRDISERKAMETELEASRERYRKLVAASPEAVLVADAETGVIVDANVAAAELLGRPRDEICGMHQSEIHPPERREHYQRLFDEHANRGGITRNVDHLSVVRPDGEEVPVEISANVSDVGNRRVVHALFKDISGRKTRERTLERLRSATRRLMTAETKLDICEIAVKAAGDTLDLPFAVILLANDDKDTLTPTTMTETSETPLDDIPRFSEGDGPVWSVFESGEATMFEGKDDHGVFEAGTEVEQEMVIPLGHHGVFLLGSPRTRTFDEYVRDFAEILSTNVQSALDRAEREETVATQRAELVELNRINEVIREVDRALVQATSRTEIEETVVGRLASAGPYEFAWIGEQELGVETVRAVANAGDTTYLESADKDAEDCPAAKALTSGRAVVLEDVAVDPTFESKGTRAFDGGFQSLAAIPIRYDETQYGVLVVHADREGAFDERERSVLVELGETIGMAIAAMESRKALASDYVMEVEMEAPDADHYLIHVPRELGCTFTLRGTTISPTGAILCFITASGAPTETILDHVGRYDGITDTRLIHERGDECVFEVTYEGPSFVKALVDRGATLGHVEAGKDGTHGMVELSADSDIRGMVEAVRSIAPGTRVVAQHEREKPKPTVSEFRMQLSESLTDRQRTALETAYLAGFFEWPRDSTGEEVAELLDVSAPTFHQHLRHAQAKVLKTFFE